MPVFTDRFQVQAELEAVALFHKDTRVLKRLTPPPVYVQIHRVQALAEGSESAFTLWFGPLPVRWLAVHSNVDPRSGFTDTQARGPLLRWQHRHHWQAAGPGCTQMEERVEYEHYPGLSGLLSRILFARPMLRVMFLYRRFAMRRALRPNADLQN
jgi:ligand-binding SRPBCC domain-containing protein